MRIAIIGCGQLAAMMGRAAKQLCLEVSFLADPFEDRVCISDLGRVVVRSQGSDASSLYLALGQPDVVTVEKEEVDVQLLEALAEFCPVKPSPLAIASTQNRALEKKALQALELPVVEYRHVWNYDEIVGAVEALGLPVIIKSCRSGYDGKNQWRIESHEQLQALADQLQQLECVVERCVNLLAECSLIGVRTAEGDLRTYPLTENQHSCGILHRSQVPVSAHLTRHEAEAQKWLGWLMDAFDYVGVMTMECFVTDQGLVINELAPRVHNSGHWTLDGAECSQFENHIRAICGLPLGSTALRAPSVMLNILGPARCPDEHAAGEGTDIESTVYWYGKASRAGRKLGHINFCADNLAAIQRAEADWHTKKSMLQTAS